MSRFPFVFALLSLLAGCAPTVDTDESSSTSGSGGASSESSMNDRPETGGFDSGRGGAAPSPSSSSTGPRGASSSGSGGSPSCVSCADAIDGSGAVGDFCSDSIGPADDLLTCSAQWCADVCPDDAYDPSAPGCAACVENACAPQLASCEADR